MGTQAMHNAALFWLALTAGLGAILWIPWVIGYAKKHGFPGALDYREPLTGRQDPDLPSWVKRADRVLMNYIETIVPFAILVILAHMLFARAEPTIYAGIGLWAMVFFIARVVHAIVYWFGIPYLRTLAFLAGFVATVAIFLQVFGRLAG